MGSPTGVFLSYLLGAVFAAGGIVFMVLLDENRFLFGIPYLVIGLLLIGGVRGAQRRRAAREGDGAEHRPGGH
ncbi:MAG: hypothetical protein AB1416_06305 [Actinomycetota bacterium]